MTNLNLAPLYRSFIGLDRVAQLARHANQQSQNSNSGYPHYNIEAIDQDQYRISMAVAGFTEQQLNIETKGNQLVITGTQAKPEQTKPEQAGSKQADKTSEHYQMLHQGIASRDFKRSFQLGDHVYVTDASLEHGMLQIELKRELPEALKPRKVAINRGPSIEQAAA